jgi:hypothetical protein
MHYEHFMTVKSNSITSKQKNSTFHPIFTHLKNIKIMRQELNTNLNMQLKTLINKINPWLGLSVSLCVIIPSLYNILDAPLTITTDHFIFGIGLFFFVIFLKEIFDRIVNLEGMD